MTKLTTIHAENIDQDGYELLKQEFHKQCTEYNITPEEADIDELF